MPLRFPVDCNTPRERTEYCYRAQELLRLLHNGMGRWYREGLTEAQWNRFPQKLKNRYPYKPQLSKEDWREFGYNIFEPLVAKVTNQLLLNRQHLLDSTNWDIHVDDLMD